MALRDIKPTRSELISIKRRITLSERGYNILKMPGSGGIITVPCEERDAVCSLERAFQAVAIDDPDSKGERPPMAAPEKKK